MRLRPVEFASTTMRILRGTYAGLRHGGIEQDDFINANAGVLVSGLSKGCGSSRETAPYAEKWAGIQLIIAKNIEKIYGQNCQNIGLLTSTDFGLIARIEQGESIPLEEFTRGLDAIGAEIVRRGGLFPYNQARLAGDLYPPTLATQKRPMNLTEKIIAQHAVVDAKSGHQVSLRWHQEIGILLNRRAFTHDYVTPPAAALFTKFLALMQSQNQAVSTHSITSPVRCDE